MKSKSLLPKILVMLFAVLVVNQIACNNASFEKADETKGQSAPAPDNFDDPGDIGESGDTVSCDNSFDLFCDRGDDGLTDEVPTLTWDPPRCRYEKDGDCYINTYPDIRRNAINGVDIWLVVDSSRSFDDERVAVGRALADGFIRDLVRQVPVNISVIAGHAPSGPYGGVRSSAPAQNSSVFYRHSSEPLTITIRNTSEISSKRAQLLAKLDEAMRESPISIAKRNGGSLEVLSGQRRSWPLRGPHSGSDELGLRNFLDAMRYASIPRDNAWVVLFMSDENDACTPFVQNGSYVYSHPTDEAEMKSWYCDGVTTSRVYAEAVQYAGDRPFALGALVYTGQAAIPSGAHPQASVGRGYTQVVAKAGANGVMVDLAAQDWMGLQNVADRLVEGLARITNNSVGHHTQFTLCDEYTNHMSLNRVETRSGRFNMQVYINGRQSNYSIDSRNSLVRPSNIRSNDELEIHFCKK